ncbi:MAG: putative nucleotide-binding protein [Alphaproteobacteria bacterium]|jgi:predicted nucleotide-binding protein
MQLEPEITIEENIKTTSHFDNKKIFIVHGQNNTSRLEVEKFIRQIDLIPIVLMDQASGGKTIIEKLEYCSDVAFGIVIYDDCDLGKQKSGTTLRPRARQNVIFEHGYLLARLGRSHIVPLLMHQEIEIPNDISGVVYLSSENWKHTLVKELKNAGLSIDANKIYEIT